MKRILMLGGSAQQIVAIQYAKTAGYYVVLCDYLKDNPGRNLADRYYPESTTDKEAVLRIARQEEIDGVIAYASDPAAPTAAYVAERLGLPTNPYLSVCALSEKHLFRKFLAENNFYVPGSFAFTEFGQAEAEQLEKLRFPVMVKPTDSSGSKGVTKADTEEQILQAVSLAKNFSRNGIFEIEEYVEKDHPHIIGGDIFVIDGKVVFWGTMNCLRDARVNELVPVGKFYPSELTENRMRLLKEEIQRLITALHMEFGGFNVEVMLTKDDKVFIMELGARCGGNMIPDMLSVIAGKNMIAAAVECSMGNYGVDIAFEGNDKCFASYVLHADRDGTLGDVRYSDKIAPCVVKKFMYKRPGDSVEYFDNAAKAVGIVFLEFQSKKEMYEVLEHIDEHIVVSIVGRG